MSTEPASTRYHRARSRARRIIRGSITGATAASGLYVAACLSVGTFGPAFPFAMVSFLFGLAFIVIDRALPHH
jgi:hypothetical protein